MARKLGVFLKDPILKYSALAAGVFIVAQIIVLIFGIKPSEEAIFLHYTTYLGVDFLGVWYLVYFIPLVSLLFFLLNGIVTFYLMHKEKLLGYLLMIGPALVGGFLLIQSILLVMLNA